MIRATFSQCTWFSLKRIFCCVCVALCLFVITVPSRAIALPVDTPISDRPIESNSSVDSIKVDSVEVDDSSSELLKPKRLDTESGVEDNNASSAEGGEQPAEAAVAEQVKAEQAKAEQVKGQAKKALGEVKRSVDEVTGQLEDVTQQLERRVQEDLGRVEQTIDGNGDADKKKPDSLADSVKEFFGQSPSPHKQNTD
jgi:hypothetical protein